MLRDKSTQKLWVLFLLVKGVFKIMIIAFQIILLIIVMISFLGTIAEQDKQLRTHLTAINISSMIACVVSFLWL